jgi:hypothetical protein
VTAILIGLSVLAAIGLLIGAFYAFYPYPQLACIVAVWMLIAWAIGDCALFVWNGGRPG